MATTPWPGIVVRCNLNESGDVPRSASSNSPDIIMAGTTPLQDPSVLTDPNNYNDPYSNALYIGQPNYLYVRGKNFTEGDLTGTWNLFYSTPNILLYPYLWQENQLATSGGNRNPAFNISAGQIGASEDSFVWVPPDTSNHYCMVAIASTPDHGNPVEGVNNINSLAEVMSTNANICQRNVQMIRGNVPEFVSTAAYDQGSEGSLLDLAVRFKNIPTGSSYTISSGTPLHGKTLSHSDTDTQDHDFSYKWIDLDIPAFWNTVFTYAITFGKGEDAWEGIPEGAHPSVEIRGEIPVDSSHKLYHLGTVAGRNPFTGQMRVDATGGPVRIVVVGSVRTECPDVKRPTDEAPHKCG